MNDRTVDHDDFIILTALRAGLGFNAFTAEICGGMRDNDIDTFIKEEHDG